MKRLLLMIMSTSMLLGILAFAPSEWSKFIEQDGVVVYTQTVVHTDANGIKQETVLFKFENTNSTEVTVTYYLEAWYGEVCRSCGVKQPNDYNRKLTIPAGQSLTGKVQGGDAALRLHSGYPDKPGHSRLSKFNLADFKVSR